MLSGRGVHIEVGICSVCALELADRTFIICHDDVDVYVVPHGRSVAVNVTEIRKMMLEEECAPVPADGADGRPSVSTVFHLQAI